MWFGGGSSANDALQLYGKLPVAKDYLRVGAGQRSGTYVRDWLDAAYGSSRDERAPELAWPARFLIVPPDGEVVQGSMWPSSDAGGHRRFPLAMFVARRRRTMLEAFDDGMETWCSSWARIEELYPALLHQPDGPTLIASLRGQRIEVGRHQALCDEPVRQDVWATALWPETGIEGLHDALRYLSDNRDSGHAGPWRLPLVNDLPLLPQVRAWVIALRTMGAIPRGQMPTLVFPQADPGQELPAFVVISLLPLSGDQARWLQAPTGGSIGAGDVTPPRSSHARGAEPPAETTPPLSDSLRGAALAFGR